MSEVIRDWIKDHGQLERDECFDRFLEQARIRAWVGDDPQRRDRIRAEFLRQWEAEKGEPGGQVLERPQPAPSRAPPAAEGRSAAAPQPPAARPDPSAAVPVHRAPRPRVAPPQGEAGISRRLNLLCPNCDQMDVWTKGHLIECRRCGRIYDNMLDLIPVQPVGPFTYMFGEGIGGAATAVGLVVLLLVIYGVFRWA